MIRLHDDIGRVVEAMAKEDPAKLTPARMMNIVGGFQEDIEIVLEQNGVEAYRAAGDPFDPRRQQVLVSEPTEEDNRVNRVARSVRPGFERGDRILRKEKVAVFVPGPGDQNAGPEEDSERGGEPAAEDVGEQASPTREQSTHTAGAAAVEDIDQENRDG